MLCTLLLSGCWDKVEIEERLFVLGIGVDKVSEQEKSQPKDRYLVSFVSPIVAALQEGEDKVFNTYKTVGELFTACLAQMYTRFAEKLSFEHTRVLIYGEDVLKDEGLFREVLDAMARAHEFHQSMYVFVVPGKAEEVFKIEPRHNKLLAMYITGVADNELYTDRISKMSAHEMYNKLLNQEGDVMMPRLTIGKDEVKITGSAIIKDYKLIGYIGEKENIYSSWIKNESHGGIVNTTYKGIIIPYTYNEFKRNIKLDKIEGGKIYLTYAMEAEGAVDEYIWDRDLLKQDVISELESELEKEIIMHSNNIIKKFKEEFQVDLIGAKEYLKKFQPETYKTIKDSYDEKFREDIVINVTAEVKIRRVGVIE
jgi:Ger(x)C family germination protein